MVEIKELYKNKQGIFPPFRDKTSLSVRAVQRGQYKNVELTIWGKTAKSYDTKNGPGYLTGFLLTSAMAQILIDELQEAIRALQASEIE